MTKWVTKKFDDFFDMLPTNTLSRDKLNDQFGIYQNIHYGDVLIKFPFCLDCGNNEIPYINEGENFNKTELKDGDVVFADTAEDDTVGKCVEVLNVGDKKIVSGLHTYLCRPKFKMAPGYLGYFLNSDAFHNQLLRYIAGSKVSSVNKTSIKNTSIFYPESLAEQKRIASILSSADNVIATSEALIEKYKSIKQGMLTDLLTPKKGWKKVKLGECCELSSEKYNPLIQTEFKDCIEMENMEQVSGTINGTSDISKLLSIKNKFRKGDVLYGKLRPYLRKYWLAKFDGVCSTEIWVLRHSEFIDAQFLFYLFQTELINKIANLSSGTKMPRADWSLMQNQELFIPDLAEQRRIAEILSSVDAKIAAEEKVVEKYKGVKKGLMGELLKSND